MITFDHVTKKYRTNIGLDDVSVHIHKGDFVFLVGPSGAGKSTFIKLILKEIDADERSRSVILRSLNCRTGRSRSFAVRWGRCSKISVCCQKRQYLRM